MQILQISFFQVPANYTVSSTAKDHRNERKVYLEHKFFRYQNIQYFKVIDMYCLWVSLCDLNEWKRIKCTHESINSEWEHKATFIRTNGV